MLRLKGATSNYACVWCKIHKTVKYPTWSYSGRWASLNANSYRHFDWKSGKTETASTVVAIWTEFTEIYKILNDRNLEKDPTEFFMKAKEWISLFVSLNGKREGYERAWVTPYMHIMVTHIPKFFELHKSVKIFTGQEVEKNNDVALAIILRKSNKWDSAGDVLQQQQCQWELKEHKQEVCSYTMCKESWGYWN